MAVARRQRSLGRGGTPTPPSRSAHWHAGSTSGAGLGESGESPKRMHDPLNHAPLESSAFFFQSPPSSLEIYFFFLLLSSFFFLLSFFVHFFFIHFSFIFLSFFRLSSRCWAMLRGTGATRPAICSGSRSASAASTPSTWPASRPRWWPTSLRCARWPSRPSGS